MRQSWARQWQQITGWIGMFTTNNCRFSRARNVITQQCRPHLTSDRDTPYLTLILHTRLAVCLRSNIQQNTVGLLVPYGTLVGWVTESVCMSVHLSIVDIYHSVGVDTYQSLRSLHLSLPATHHYFSPTFPAIWNFKPARFYFYFESPPYQ